MSQMFSHLSAEDVRGKLSRSTSGQSSWSQVFLVSSIHGSGLWSHVVSEDMVLEVCCFFQTEVVFFKINFGLKGGVLTFEQCFFFYLSYFL